MFQVILIIHRLKVSFPTNHKTKLNKSIFDNKVNLLLNYLILWSIPCHPIQQVSSHNSFKMCCCSKRKVDRLYKLLMGDILWWIIKELKKRWVFIIVKTSPCTIIKWESAQVKISLCDKAKRNPEEGNRVSTITMTITRTKWLRVSTSISNNKKVRCLLQNWTKIWVNHLIERIRPPF